MSGFLRELGVSSGWKQLCCRVQIRIQLPIVLPQRARRPQRIHVEILTVTFECQVSSAYSEDLAAKGAVLLISDSNSTTDCPTAEGAKVEENTCWDSYNDLCMLGFLCVLCELRGEDCCSV